MKLIDLAMEGKLKLKISTYTKSDIIRYMCPIELGLDDIDCENENGHTGIEACRHCWDREYSNSPEICIGT